MDTITKAKNILFNPNGCWSDLKKEKGISEALSYLLITLLVGAIIYYSSALVTLAFASKQDMGKILSFAAPLGLSIYSAALLVTIIIFVILFIATFINSGIMHPIVKLFKGKGDFADTYKAFVYGATPHFLLLSVPYINSLSYFYMLYLQIIGLSKLHKITIWKAVFAEILSSIVLFILILGPILLFIFLKIT